MAARETKAQRATLASCLFLAVPGRRTYAADLSQAFRFRLAPCLFPPLSWLSYLLIYPCRYRLEIGRFRERRVHRVVWCLMPLFQDL